MWLRKWIGTYPQAIWSIRITGLCLFIAAFFLPACKTGGVGLVQLKGWECAWYALALPVAHLFQPDPDNSRFELLLLSLSGFLNLAVVAHFSSIFFQKARPLRTALTIAIPACMLATWIYFALEDLAPVLGHYLWIAGALLIVAPDFPGWSRTSGPAHVPGDEANDDRYLRRAT